MVSREEVEWMPPTVEGAGTPVTHRLSPALTRTTALIQTSIITVRTNKKLLLVWCSSVLFNK